MSDPVAVARRSSGGPPAWVFVEEFASFSDVRNATTATGVTSAGRPVTVSFELVDPPGVSRWSVHCPGLKKDRGFNGSPQILNAAGAFVDEETTYDAVVLHSPTKAVAAGGGGSLAWIDLWHGVLLCTWLDDGQPVLRLIQWPMPPPRRGVPIEASLVELRDATMTSDGAIKFVELRLRYDGPSPSYFSMDASAGDRGWTATVWKRHIGSGYGWGVGFKADTYNVFADDSRSRLVRRMRDEDGVDLNKMVTAGPRLSLHDEDVVYMEAKSSTDPSDPTALVLAINAREERLEAAQQIPSRACFSTFPQCTFSRFLDTSPGCL
ncbi:unnamed protein product [Urochloa decumbens]|uniref:DUF1618 domain-containing protein n=1 Tax=Urochloa decumbens TaxID=240449 RepID=A0ABC8Y8I7_9POAL